MEDTKDNIKVYATEEEADALYMRRAETDAKGLAVLLGLTVQRVYQLRDKGVITLTKNGNYNIADSLAAYSLYKNTGDILPPSQEPSEGNGYFMEITEKTQVNTAQLAAILGTTPSHIDRLTRAGILKTAEPGNGIADFVQAKAIAELDLHTLLKELGETDEAIAEAERKRDAFLAAVEYADTAKPSRSKWELYAVQDRFKDFLEALPADLTEEAKEEL